MSDFDQITQLSDVVEAFDLGNWARSFEPPPFGTLPPELAAYEDALSAIAKSIQKSALANPGWDPKKVDQFIATSVLAILDGYLRARAGIAKVCHCEFGPQEECPKHGGTTVAKKKGA